MTNRRKRPSRRRRSKIDKTGKTLARVWSLLKNLLVLRTAWKLLKELIGDDPWEPPRLSSGAASR